ncbi:MAG: anaerobic ribonucleoside-triphosphate reductase activating protein [Muribaculaceae bacterium]|nr:anaerobic ribonucleoside-triphosphate reductase activating protein [Muribaculaceae bacterium]
MADTISVAKIVMSTCADGPGLRNALYVAGCPLRCEGCHNAAYWDKDSGTEMSVGQVFSLLDADDFNISILGGEPLMQYEAIVSLCRMIKERTSKTIWLWSGYTLEYIRERFPAIPDIIDTLVDGPYVHALRDTSLLWRGSANQRIHHLRQPSATLSPDI